MSREAFSLADAGRVPDAVALLQRAFPLYPQDAELRNTLGIIYFNAGDAGSAMEQFFAALGIDKAYRKALLNLGDVLDAINKEDDAHRIYSHCLGIYPGDAELIGRVGKMEAKRTVRQGWQDLMAMLAGGRRVNLVRFFRSDTGELAGRIGELATNFNLFLRFRELGKLPSDEEYIFFSGPPANQQLQTMFKRRLNIIENPLLLEAAQSFAPVLEFDQVLQHQSNEYPVYQASAAPLSFTPDEEQRGRGLLRELGMGADDWFVCVFARDPLYISTAFPGVDHTHNGYRDADINSYQLAIEEIVQAGGYVLRMGSAPRQALQLRHPRVIDYAVSHRNDFMDIYLMGHCRFALGTPSGICDIPYLFDVPFVGVNVVPLGYAPVGKNCLFIPKKPRCSKTGAYVHFARFMNDLCDRSDPALFNGNDLLARGYLYEDNSAEEIQEVALEMLQRVSGSFTLSDAELALHRNYRSLVPPHHWNANNQTPIGTGFLKRHARTIFEGI